MPCAPSEDSDQPGHPPCLIRVFAVRIKKAWVLSYPLSAQRRLWSDWADTQADLSLRWAHSHFVGFVVRRLKCTFNIYNILTIEKCKKHVLYLRVQGVPKIMDHFSNCWCFFFLFFFIFSKLLVFLYFYENFSKTFTYILLKVCYGSLPCKSHTKIIWKHVSL